MPMTKVPLPHIYQICKSVPVQISDDYKYISTCALYELTIIYNVTTATGILMLILLTYAPTNMSAILHIYITLHCNYSIQIEPILLTYQSKKELQHLFTVLFPYMYQE